MSAWADEEVEQVKKLWQRGLSAVEIARQVGGGRTRNAIAGLIHRCGFRGNAPAQKARAVKPPRPKAPPTPRLLPPARPKQIIEPPPISGPRPTLLELTEHACRWPLGDPRDADMKFCGAHQHGMGPYCSIHATAAYEKAPVVLKQKRAA